MSEMNRITVGSIVEFGSWEQCSGITARTPIDWLVLETDGQTAVLISKRGLEFRAYHDEKGRINWDGCALRAWLNGPFLEEAFTAEEQARIRTVDLETRAYGEDDADIVIHTQDRVWLLSDDEAERYFAADDEWKCLPTERALSYDAWFWNEVYGDGLECAWWLRSTGDSPDRAGVVLDYGMVVSDGWSAGREGPAVRPVIVLELA